MREYRDYLVKEKKEFWRKNPLNGEINICIENLNVDDFLMYSENDDTVVKELYWTSFKGWELTSLTLWENLLQNKHGGIVIDVGSYSGIYSLIASKVSKNFSIYAFDIQKKCIKRLEKNIEINNINNLKVLLSACTNNNEEISFYFYEEEGILSSVASIVPNKMNDLEEKVTSIKLDDFFENNISQDNVEMIKIDVEGAENETLSGLRNILNKNSPDVLIEVNKSQGLSLVKEKFPKGYSIYDINEDKLELRRLNWIYRPSKHRNYLFTKKKKAELREIFSGKIK